MGIPDDFTCLLRSLMQVKNRTVRTGYGTMDWLKNWERTMSGLYILSPCLFNICRVHHSKCCTGWIKIWTQDCRRSINNLRYADDTTLMTESEKELKSLLIKVNEESKKAGLKLNIQKTKITASSPDTSKHRWRKNGNSDRFYFLGLQRKSQTLTAAMKLKEAYSLEEKLWRT